LDRRAYRLGRSIVDSWPPRVDQGWRARRSLGEDARELLFEIVSTAQSIEGDDDSGTTFLWAFASERDDFDLGEALVRCRPLQIPRHSENGAWCERCGVGARQRCHLFRLQQAAKAFEHSEDDVHLCLRQGGLEKHAANASAMR
jgi:hypothetical protein